MFCPEEVKERKKKQKTKNSSSSVGKEFVLFLNRTPQNRVEVCPQTVLAPLLLELVAQCPTRPSVLCKEGV